MKRIFALLFLALWLPCVALGNYPEKIEYYFNDFAGAVSKEKANAFDAKLKEFDKAHDTQVVVAIFPKLEGDVLDVTTDLVRKWKVGNKKNNAGILLTIFLTSDSGKGKVWLNTSGGLEGALTDGEWKVIYGSLVPILKAKQYDKAIDLALKGIFDNIKGEYTAKVDEKKPLSAFAIIVIILIVLFIIILICAAGGGSILVAIVEGIASSGGSSGGGGGGSWSSGGGGDFGGGGGGGDF